MARKRKRKYNRQAVQREYHHHIANRQKVLKRPYRVPKLDRYRRHKDVYSKEELPDDRREYRPPGRRPLTVYGTEADFSLRNKSGTKNIALQTKSRLGFKRPQKVAICRRRHERRISLFALGRAGKGIKGPKKKQYNEYSDVRC